MIKPESRAPPAAHPTVISQGNPECLLPGEQKNENALLKINLSIQIDSIKT